MSCSLVTMTDTTLAAGPQLDQQIHALVDIKTRQFTLGYAAKITAALTFRKTPKRPVEGEAVRLLLADMLEFYEVKRPAEFAEIMALGVAEMRRRGLTEEVNAEPVGGE